MKTHIILFALAVAAVLAMVVTKEEKTYNLKPMTQVSTGFWVETGVGDESKKCFASYKKEANFEVFGRAGGLLNIKYTNRYASGAGNDCPEKVVFSMERERFSEKMILREEFLRYWERINAMAEIARNEHWGTRPAQVEPGWVTVANFGGVETKNGTRTPFHGRCTLINSIGNYNVIVDARDLYLVRFTGRGGEGTQCPDGTMFFAVNK